MTLLAALTPAGIGPAVTIPGAVDGPAFIADAERVLAPSLRPGQIVVLDNLSAHKRADAYTAIEAVGCRLLFLPASSPDVNPIELAFAKGKERLRAASERTPDGLFTATSLAIDAVSALDARGFSAPYGFSLPSKYYANRSRRRPAVIRRPRCHRSPALAACARSARGCGRAVCIRSWTAPFAEAR
jgi:transposase